MSFPSVTNVFTNGTTIDAGQVNTNFQDLINGMSDGTKDLNVNVLNTSGATTLGNSTTDDITITGSLASSIPIKTNNSFDIGSAALGLAGVYLGAAGAVSTRLISGATASHTITLPATSGSDGYVLRNLGSGVTTFQPLQRDVFNYSISASVGANALTIALKGADGNDPSSSNKVTAEFRNATLTTGTPSFGSATSAVSLVISSGSTLGHVASVAEYIYVYLINNAGVLELAASTSNSFDEGIVYTTTSEGGGGAADSRTTLYSTTARSNIAVKLIGRITSNQATPGTWASSPTAISLMQSYPIFSENSEVWVDTTNGHGSTNTRIRRWTNTNKNTGTAITYADSAGNGGTFTINEAGIYAMAYSDQWSNAVDHHGVSLNSSQLTTDLDSITRTDRIAFVHTSSASTAKTAQITLRLNPGDVIRCHSAGNASGANTHLSSFRITKVSS